MRQALRLGFILLCSFLGFVGSAQAPAAVAELSVRAFGTQRLDLSSGMTILEQGGEVIDQVSGTRLTAAWIAYAEGESLLAKEVELQGSVGLLDAAELSIDLRSGRVTALGGVALSRPGLQVQAQTMGMDPEAGLAWLLGDVVVSQPSASAAEAWIDLQDGRVLLLGEYSYQDGPFELRGGAGSMLQLDPIELEAQASFDARTGVDEELWARVRSLREGAPASSPAGG